MRSTPASDPWAVERPAPRSVRARLRAMPGAWRAVAAWALASLVLIRVWVFGGGVWRDVVAAALLGGAFEVALRTARGRHRWWILRLAGLSAIAAAMMLVLGPTSAVVFGGALVVADAALVSWHPIRTWPRRRTSVATLSIGVLVASEMAWNRGVSPAIGVVGIALAMGIVELYGRAPEAVASIEAAIGRATGALATSVVHVALFVLAFVVMYLPGAAAEVVAHVAGRRRRRGSNWRAVKTSVTDARHDAKRPFTSTDPDVRWNRTLRGLALVSVVALVAVVMVQSRDGTTAPGFGLPFDGSSSPPASTKGDGSAAPAPSGPRIFATELDTPYSSLPAYRGQQFADDIQAEEAAHVVDGNKTGKYVNIRYGRRATIDPPRCMCPEASLWLSGGSAAFGTGQRDSRTIASDLVRIAARRDHIALHVTNVSHDGYTFQMETQWEIYQSLRTEKRPDLIVFYNGWNDAMAQMATDYLEGYDAGRARSTIIPAQLAAINQDTKAFLSWSGGPRSGRAAADRYLRIQRETNEVAAGLGVKTAYFFQADALGSRLQMAPYQDIVGISTDQMLASPLSETLDAMEHRLGSNITDLRHVFDESDEPVFLGLVHQNEAGAETIAERIYEKLRPEIIRLAHRAG